VDLGAALQHGYDLSLKKSELDEERTARLVEAAHDADFRRRKDWWTFVAMLVTSVGIGGAAFVLAIMSTGDLQKWAMGLVTLLLGGAIGYWSGTRAAKAG
jgi:hypothetical protein